MQGRPRPFCPPPPLPAARPRHLWQAALRQLAVQPGRIRRVSFIVWLVAWLVTSDPHANGKRKTARIRQHDIAKTSMRRKGPDRRKDGLRVVFACETGLATCVSYIYHNRRNLVCAEKRVRDITPFSTQFHARLSVLMSLLWGPPLDTHFPDICVISLPSETSRSSTAPAQIHASGPDFSPSSHARPGRVRTTLLISLPQPLR